MDGVLNMLGAGMDLALSYMWWVLSQWKYLQEMFHISQASTKTDVVGTPKERSH